MEPEHSAIKKYLISRAGFSEEEVSRLDFATLEEINDAVDMLLRCRIVYAHHIRLMCSQMKSIMGLILVLWRRFKDIGMRMLGEQLEEMEQNKNVIQFILQTSPTTTTTTTILFFLESEEDFQLLKEGRMLEEGRLSLVVNPLDHDLLKQSISTGKKVLLFIPEAIGETRFSSIVESNNKLVIPKLVDLVEDILSLCEEQRQRRVLSQYLAISLDNIQFSTEKETHNAVRLLLLLRFYKVLRVHIRHCQVSIMMLSFLPHLFCQSSRLGLGLEEAVKRLLRQIEDHETLLGWISRTIRKDQIGILFVETTTDVLTKEENKKDQIVNSETHSNMDLALYILTFCIFALTGGLVGDVLTPW